MKTVAVVPAAGFAERFGSDKLLTPIGDMPMVTKTVRALLDGGVDRVVVVVPPGASEVREAVRHSPAVTIEVNHVRERGMFSSIQAGLRTATGDPILVLPGDMPYVQAATVAMLLRRYAESPAILSPRFNGKRGHPVVIPGKYRDEIRDAPEGVTLHEVLRAHASERVDVDVGDKGVVRDVDVPGDLAP